jgi:predicted nucleotidyltransferase component of viral defense system
MNSKIVNLQASVTQRLRNIAREKQASFEVILRRYAIERLLYRITQSPERNRFVLKGAMLYTAWVADPFRPTQDLDLLGLGDDAAPAMAEAFRAICQQKVPDDGVTFDTASIRADAIRGNQEYGGVRVRMTAHLGNVRIPEHIDIGFGDAVTPGIVELTFPALLDAPAPQLRAYPKETVIAEKFEAIVALGQANSRMKDYYDLVALSRLFDFDGAVVRNAIAATFERRGTALPARRPPGLAKAFARDRQKVVQWTAFVQREPLLLSPGDLVEVVQEVGLFVMGPGKAARAGKPFTHKLRAGGPWRAKRIAAGKTDRRRARPKRAKGLTRPCEPQHQGACPRKKTRP